jgi:pilus assembly protein Flp/PilA
VRPLAKVVLEAGMRNALALIKEFKPIVERFKKDENGAALIEYTVLIGIMLVAVIAIIVFVGGWVSGQWSALSTKL